MKRLLALFLCLVTVLTLIPSAAAEDIEIIDTEPVGVSACDDPQDGLIAVEPELPAEPTAGKPTITSQPESVTVGEGKTAAFTVGASGAAAYQWYWRKNADAAWSKSTLTGYDTATLSVKATTARSGYEYRCRVSNGSGAVYSDIVSLTVITKPEITAQPESVSAAAGTIVTFTVMATGATAYQWYYRTGSGGSWAKSTMTGSDSATLSVPVKAGRNGYQYRCRVSNGAGYVYSEAATLTVTAKPKITAQPEDVTAAADTTARFTVTATGATAYQWYYRTGSSGSWAKSTMTGSDTETLSVPVKAGRNGYQYRCRVSNSAGYVYSTAATLKLLQKPTILTQPEDTASAAGVTVQFFVEAEGAETYQWQYRKSADDDWKDSTGTGCRTDTLQVKAAAYRSGYQYRCRITNSLGTVYSHSVTLKILTAPVITAQPTSQTSEEFGSASFSLSAEGEDLSYQWYWWKESENDWVACGGVSAKTRKLLYTNLSYSWNGYRFCCRVTNAAGTVSSDEVTLTVERVAPIISAQPESITITEGAAAAFSVSSPNAESYQWYWRKSADESWQKVSSTKAGINYVNVGTAWNGYQFRCRVKNSAGGVYSKTATLTVVSCENAPTITTHPKSVTINEGESVTFRVEAENAVSFQWYWRKNADDGWREVSSTAKSITYSNVRSAWNGYQFRCEVTNSAGSVYSKTATLKIAESSGSPCCALPAGEAGLPAVIADPTWPS